LRVIGVDEAGRGSVFGPLVIAGVSIDNAIDLKALGVKDSKKLSPKKRETLFSQLSEINGIEMIVKELKPSLIDRYVLNGQKHMKLNYLEAKFMSLIISSLHGELAVVDAADTSERLFASQISSFLKRKVMLISSHHADDIYPVVSAASIIAKVNRDKMIRNIQAVYGKIGSGYPSDPLTREYLRENIGSINKMPFVRRSWKTLKRVLE
jgi:ribonuclease HII